MDVEELRGALRKLGISLTSEEVFELMEGVDDDGSGELEFPEFVTTMRRLVDSGPAQSDWDIQMDHIWVKEVKAGVVFGETMLLATEAKRVEGSLVALEDSTILYLERADYENIIENGFDGNVRERMELLKTAPILSGTLKSSNLRALAFATTTETFYYNEAVYKQASFPNSLYLILEGECKVG